MRRDFLRRLASRLYTLFCITMAIAAPAMAVVMFWYCTSDI